MENPLAVANYFIQKSFDTGAELTPMKLVKLVYIAHGWHLGLSDEPLLSEPVQAWKYGPVIESVYHNFRQFADGQITQMYSIPTHGSQLITPMVDETKHEFLDKVWEVYKDYNGIQLSTLTHQSDSPWYEVWNRRGGKNSKSAIIPNDIIKDHFKTKIDAAPQPASQP